MNKIMAPMIWTWQCHPLKERTHSIRHRAGAERRQIAFDMTVEHTSRQVQLELETEIWGRGYLHMGGR